MKRRIPEMPKPRKTEVIFARVTKGEKETAIALAKKFGLDLSEVVRHGLAMLAQASK